MATISSPEDPLMGKGVIALRQASKDTLVIIGTIKMLPETIAKFPHYIGYEDKEYMSDIVLIGSLGIQVDVAALGPEIWKGLTADGILTSPLRLADCELIDNPIQGKISCLDTLQFMEVSNMMKAIEGE